METKTTIKNRIIHLLERIHLGYWLFEMSGGKAAAVAGLIAGFISGSSRSYGIKPPEMVFLGLVSFLVVIATWAIARHCIKPDPIQADAVKDFSATKKYLFTVSK